MLNPLLRRAPGHGIGLDHRDDPSVTIGRAMSRPWLHGGTRAPNASSPSRPTPKVELPTPDKWPRRRTAAQPQRFRHLLRFASLHQALR